MYLGPWEIGGQQRGKIQKKFNHVTNGVHFVKLAEGHWKYLIRLWKQFHRSASGAVISIKCLPTIRLLDQTYRKENKGNDQQWQTS